MINKKITFVSKNCRINFSDKVALWGDLIFFNYQYNLF